MRPSWAVRCSVAWWPWRRRGYCGRMPSAGAGSDRTRQCRSATRPVQVELEEPLCHSFTHHPVPLGRGMQTVVQQMPLLDADHVPAVEEVQVAVAAALWRGAFGLGPCGVCRPGIGTLRE